MHTSDVTPLETSVWRSRRKAHEERLGAWVADQLERRERGEKHPVYDFLFEYYTFKASQLMQWTPGAGAVLEGAEVDVGETLGMDPVKEGWWLDPAQFPEQRRGGLEWVLELLRAIQGRAPRTGCFGLHEWAMVYKRPPEKIRHTGLALRVSPDVVEEMVTRYPVVCSHYDAFRFFTPDAKPLNRFQPESQTRNRFEQPGCIHVNMDLYKWSYKFYPWVASELMADAFELAIAAREVDMRASPYDVEALGFEPILIETEAGRVQYQQEQEAIVARGRPILKRLIGALEYFC